MTRVAVAASSQLAADAGAEVAELGGNAVDAAIASSLVQLVTEPGVVSLAAGAFVVIWQDGEPPVMVDGASEMPGRAAPPERFGQGGLDALLLYGGGTPTTVGYGSVATPGALAGYELAAQRYGTLPWRALLAPAERHVRRGFPLPEASARYLEFTHAGIFGWNREALEPLTDGHGALKRTGDTVHIEHLADSLALIAEEGTRAFYQGELAGRIVDDMDANGGLLGRADLAAYKARLVPALEVVLDDWHLATAPAPSVGGAVLAAMLLMLRDAGHDAWSPALTGRVIDVQQAVMGYRRRQLDRSHKLDEDIAQLLESAGTNPSALSSPSTVHTSTADSSGLVCAITASAGYGSGVMPPGTGIWLNNSLGEVELNKRGFHALHPGERVPSNMAPTVGRGNGGGGLAIGSPGADRITTAILQTLLNYVHLDMPLAAAVNHPRLHVEWPQGEASRVAFEPGLPVAQLDVRQRRFDTLDMFFGGVSAVTYSTAAGFELAADVRRTGGTALSSGRGH